MEYHQQKSQNHDSWAWCTPGYSWLFGLPGHTAGLCFICCQLEPPDLFLQGCFPCAQCPNCIHICLVVHLNCRTQHLLLLNFIWLVIVSPPICRSLCKASLPLKELTTPPSLVLFLSFLNEPSSPALMKALKRAVPKTEPCRTLPVTDMMPFSNATRYK